MRFSKKNGALICVLSAFYFIGGLIGQALHALRIGNTDCTRYPHEKPRFYIYSAKIYVEDLQSG